MKKPKIYFKNIKMLFQKNKSFKTKKKKLKYIFVSQYI